MNAKITGVLVLAAGALLLLVGYLLLMGLVEQPGVSKPMDGLVPIFAGGLLILVGAIISLSRESLSP